MVEVMIMRPKGSSGELFHRRQRAMKLLDQGLSQVEVARRVDADVRSVQRWRRRFEAGGEEALRPKPVPGAPPKLTAKQREALRAILVKGAKAAGFESELWTGRRVAAVVRKHFGVTYHERYVLRLLRALGLTPQRPEPVARERDPEAKAHWLHWQWPALKKNRPPSGRMAGVSR